MAETLVEFEQPVVGRDGSVYGARAVGAEMSDSRWQGWIEFVPIVEGGVLRSPRETTQPNRTDVVYWASGLTHVYLEGALDRAQHRPVVVESHRADPTYEEPAPDFLVERVGPGPMPTATALDPFSVYEKGELMLRRQLNALASWHLVNIIRAHGFASERALVAGRASHGALVELIVDGVKRRVERVASR